jgi:hypothetical protein|tara:strand:+ start:64 stop:375 length:312 start_codon:yes stop_codon:yes gene_type:complete
MRKPKSKLEYLKKNIVIIPVIGAILAGTFTSVRYVLTMTDTIQINKEILQNVTQDLEMQKEVLSDIKNRLARAEATWDMAENIFQQLADQVRQHEYDIKDLNR